MAPPISFSDFIRDFIHDHVPFEHLRNSKSREKFVRACGLNEIMGYLTFEGSLYEFLDNLIEICTIYGRLKRGEKKIALLSLLDGLIQFVDKVTFDSNELKLRSMAKALGLSHVCIIAKSDKNRYSPFMTEDENNKNSGTVFQNFSETLDIVAQKGKERMSGRYPDFEIDHSFRYTCEEICQDSFNELISHFDSDKLVAILIDNCIFDSLSGRSCIDCLKRVFNEASDYRAENLKFGIHVIMNGKFRSIIPDSDIEANFVDQQCHDAGDIIRAIWPDYDRVQMRLQSKASMASRVLVRATSQRRNGG